MKSRGRSVEIALVLAVEVVLIQSCAVLWPPSHWVKTTHAILPPPPLPISGERGPHIHPGKRP